MSAAFPPVVDCGCGTTSSTSEVIGIMTGTANPNTIGLVPSDPTVWQDYLQLLDPISGPPISRFSWNPNLRVWQ